LCRLKLKELYPQLNLGIPETDDPRPRSRAEQTGESSWTDDQGGIMCVGVTVRRRTGSGGGSLRQQRRSCLLPLEYADFTNTPVVESRDYSDEEKLYQMYRKGYPEEWGDRAPEGEATSTGFYNTMFMWPLLTFGWELFLETCLDPGLSGSWTSSRRSTGGCSACSAGCL